MKIGYTTGAFDLFHIGHLNIIKKAKSQCDYLIVGISTDENIVAYKGSEPIIGFENRVEIIRSLKYVDHVVPQENMDKLAAWKNLGFNLYFHGDDWKNNREFNESRIKLESVGVRVVLFEYTQKISTTIIKEKIWSMNSNSDEIT